MIDGYPLTKKQVDLMTEWNIIPVRVVELDVDSKEVVVRGVKDRIAPTRYDCKSRERWQKFYS